MHPSEFDLLEAWAGGSKQAGQRLFASHFDALYRFFRNKVGDDAGDLVQATLLACMESRGTFRRDCAFRTFVFAVARNILLRHFDSRRRGERFDPMVESAADAGATPTQLLEVKQHHKYLLEALRRIALEHQMLLELHYWERLVGPELAVILGVPEGTVRTRLRRAKQLLLAEVERLAGQEVRTREQDLDGWAAEVRQHLVAAGLRPPAPT